MNNGRQHERPPVLMILVVLGLLIHTPLWASTGQASAQVTAPSWIKTGSLSTSRSGFTATLLPNGTVLVAGGSGTSGGLLASAEIYEPSTGTWRQTGSLNLPRVYHSATLLQNGKVLVAGGWANNCCLELPDNSAEIYDPETGRWSMTGNLNHRRFDHTATLLSNGTVLFAGGAFSTSETAELYDPATGTWRLTGNLNGPRVYHSATLLRNGKVLVVGGCGDGECFLEVGSAELYDPNTGAWSDTGGLNTSRYAGFTTTALPNGTVLLAGGACCFSSGRLQSAHQYNPATGQWTNTGFLLNGRYGHTATLLHNGLVLVEGGDIQNTAELYDPVTGNWTATASLNKDHAFRTATLLQSGKVLFVGGLDAELYDAGSSSTINPIDDARFFIRQQYVDFLGREPDPEGFAGWLNILNNCGITVAQPCDRLEVSSAFFRSPEFQGRGYFIYRFYRTIGKVPIHSEFMPDFARVSGFLTDAELEIAKATFVTDFTARPEFQHRYGSTFTSPTTYVDALLLTVGLPGHPGRAGWINALNSANNSQTRAQVLRQLVESREVYEKFYNEAFVIMQYFGYLRRTADAAYLNWIQTMNQNSGDYRVMINGFVNSSEYRRRFGP